MRYEWRILSPPSLFWIWTTVSHTRGLYISYIVIHNMRRRTGRKSLTRTRWRAMPIWHLCSATLSRQVAAPWVVSVRTWGGRSSTNGHPTPLGGECLHEHRNMHNHFQTVRINHILSLGCLRPWRAWPRYVSSRNILERNITAPLLMV